MPEDLKAREAYLRRQRDRLLEMRRKERAQKFDSFGTSSSSRQVARTMAERVPVARGQTATGTVNVAASSREEGGAKMKEGDFDTGVLCSTIATRMKEVDQQ